MSPPKRLLVYLAGHIHDDWRGRVRRLTEERDLPVDFCGPREDHSRSDNVGFDILGLTPDDVGPALAARLRDEYGGAVNNFRTRIWLRQCDLMLAFFDGDHANLRQWNTASDIGVAQALGKPVIVARSPSFTHSLKELGPRADVVVDSLEQAVDALAYIFED